VRRLLVCQRMAGPVSEEASFSIAVADVPPGFTSKSDVMARRTDPLCRSIAWGAMIAGSMVPMIFGRSAGEDGYSVPVAQVLILVIAAAILSRSSRLRAVGAFLLTIAILRLSWSVIVPVLSDWLPVQSLMNNLDWGPKIFATRLLNVAGALLMLTTLVGRHITRDDLFLRIGKLNAPVKPERILWFRSPLRWWHLGPLIIVIFAMAMTAFLFSHLRPNFWQLSQHWQLFPWAVATAALNAANEEFQFRCVPLAHLRNVLPLHEAVWLTALFFGLAHYFGQPSGWLGVVMATIAGFIWAKSMVETRGVGWAFGIHMLQDVVIFYFLAMSLRN
jgi:membrane protease YdiL (CAAX protease family)